MRKFGGYKGGGGGGGGGGRRRRKVDRFLADKSLVIDYKDPSALKYFITERGKIVPRRVSGLTAKNQRKITQAIKRARMVALMPFTTVKAH
ncbi:MAG: small subunit ribosomal protein S18 [Bradymonadia bacterium]|jgi:small subunit ribosomal protein S18